MTINRENVIWKGRDGKWNVGFFDYYQTGDDPEWDVEYDYTRFNFVSVGHVSEHAARAAWRGANPGESSTYHEPSTQTDQYDEMAKTYLAANPNHRREWQRVW